MAEVDPNLDPPGSKPMFFPLPLPQGPLTLSAGNDRCEHQGLCLPLSSTSYHLPYPPLLESLLGSWNVVLVTVPAQKGQSLLPFPCTLIPTPMSQQKGLSLGLGGPSGGPACSSLAFHSGTELATSMVPSKAKMKHPPPPGTFTITLLSPLGPWLLAPSSCN